MRLAIPEFRARISPVFDHAGRLLLIDLDGGIVRQRSVLWMQRYSYVERLALLKRASVNALICASISGPLRTILRESGVRVIEGVVGDVEEVLSAFIQGTLDHPRYAMPGCRKGKRLQRRRRGRQGRSLGAEREVQAEPRPVNPGRKRR